MLGFPVTAQGTNVTAVAGAAYERYLWQILLTKKYTISMYGNKGSLTPTYDPIKDHSDDASKIEDCLVAMYDNAKDMPARIENERVGRFALWGFRSGE